MRVLVVMDPIETVNLKKDYNTIYISIKVKPLV